jgi:hypothetical protein
MERLTKMLVGTWSLDKDFGPGGSMWQYARREQGKWPLGQEYPPGPDLITDRTECDFLP